MNIHLIASGEAHQRPVSLAAELRSRWPWAECRRIGGRGGKRPPDTWLPPDLTIILGHQSLIVALAPSQATEAGWLRLGADVVVRAHSIARMLALLEAFGSKREEKTRRVWRNVPSATFVSNPASTLSPSKARG